MKLRRIGRDSLNFMPHFVRNQKSALISCRLNFMSSFLHVALISCFKVALSKSTSHLSKEIPQGFTINLFWFPCFWNWHVAKIWNYCKFYRSTQKTASQPVAPLKVYLALQSIKCGTKSRSFHKVSKFWKILPVRFSLYSNMIDVGKFFLNFQFSWFVRKHLKLIKIH